jgi:hypothetical protein
MTSMMIAGGLVAGSLLGASASASTSRPADRAVTVGAKPAPAKAAACAVGVMLVPTCGVLWGAAAGGFTTIPRDQALKTWETQSGRTSTIFHTYHRGDEKFPTKAEIVMARDPQHPRVLFLNWNIDVGTTWAAVAAGKHDGRIDAFVTRIKATFPERFFLALHHEPEDDVKGAGSGMTAKDYAKMYRHTILRLRAKGLTNMVNVVALMGNGEWMAKSWWADLYPGDDVVDWIGLDSYLNAEEGYHHGDFADLLDRAPKGSSQGFYRWATTKHAGKPIMVAEWGVYHRTRHIADKAAVFSSVVAELKKRPAVKAMVYFDTASDRYGDRNISISSSSAALKAFKKIAADPIFNVALQ